MVGPRTLRDRTGASEENAGEVGFCNATGLLPLWSKLRLRTGGPQAECGWKTGVI